MENKLPADPTALILGIIGLIFGLVGCCCYGITAIIPLGLSIVGLVMANKSLKLYRANPSEFSESSRSNVSIGRILNIISIVVNSLFLVVIILMIVFVGVAGVQGAFDSIKDKGFGNENTKEWEYEDDFNDDATYEIEEVDSISSDSVFLNEVYPENDSLQ